MLWGAPSNSQPKPIARQVLADDRTWCRRSRNPQHAAARQPGSGRFRLTLFSALVCSNCLLSHICFAVLDANCSIRCKAIADSTFDTLHVFGGSSRLQDGGPQSAEDGVVKSCAPPRAAIQQPAGAGCRTAATCRLQEMVSSEPASPPRAAVQQTAGAGCRTAASGMQKMVESNPAGPRAPRPCNRQEPAAGLRPVEFRRWCRWTRSEPARPPRAAALQPVGAGCRTAARRVQYCAEDGVVGASEPPAQQPCNRPEPAAGRRPTECRRWCSRIRRAPRAQQPCNQPEQAAEDGVVEACEPPAPHPSNQQEPAA